MRTPSAASSPGLPWHLVPKYAIALVGRYAIRREVAASSSIDHTTIDDAIDAQSRQPSRWDRLVQWMFRESTILPAPLHDLAIDSFRVENVPFSVLVRITRWYCALTRALGVAWPDGLPEARRRQLATILPEDVQLPSFREPLELLEFALGELDLLDLVRPAPDGSPGTLVLCTAFVDRFELKNLVGDRYGITPCVCLGERAAASAWTGWISVDGDTPARRFLQKPRGARCGVSTPTSPSTPPPCGGWTERPGCSTRRRRPLAASALN